MILAISININWAFPSRQGVMFVVPPHVRSVVVVV